MKNTFVPADILLPKSNVAMERWSVVACDQFTSEPEYWRQVEAIVGDAPSTKNLILPEVYLGGGDEEERLSAIGASMDRYLEEDIFERYENAMIYVERTDSTGKLRAGLVGCIDLEQYDYRKGSGSPVRASEATVEERIPPRIKVRRQAKLELPHIMILVDDAERTVVEPLAEKKEACRLLYDFDLMLGGGHLRGYLLTEEMQAAVEDALSVLGSQEHFEAKYDAKGQPAMLFAVGDGNHSLASAKAYYEELKKGHPGRDFSGHPARYALCEIVNIHSPALEFEAIHRIVRHADADELLQSLKEKLAVTAEGEGQTFYAVKKGVREKMVIGNPSSKLTVGSLQNFLDDYAKTHDISMDYIHGEKTLCDMTMEEGSVGFLLPDMGKEELFPTVIFDGALPRKTFSMGHAEDKRYYTEARVIKRKGMSK